MLRWINPVHYIQRIIDVRNDMQGKREYLEHLPNLYRDGFFKNYRKRLSGESMYLGVDLLPEIKLQNNDTWKLENEEKRRLAVEVSKFNDVFAKHGLLEFVKMIPVKVDTDDYYGFMVEVVYLYSHLSVKTISYITFYTLSLLGIFGGAAYLLKPLFL